MILLFSNSNYITMFIKNYLYWRQVAVIFIVENVDKINETKNIKCPRSFARQFYIMDSNIQISRIFYLLCYGLIINNNVFNII